MVVEQDVSRAGYSLTNKGGSIFLPDWCLDGLINLEIPSEADLVTHSSSQKYPISTLLLKSDGTYRYSKSGEALAIGHQGFLKVNKSICPGGTGGVGYEGAVYENAAAGATAIKITHTTATLNEFEDAFLMVPNDTTGHMDFYRVIGNDAAVSSTYTVIYIAPPGLKAAHTTTSGTLDLYKSPYINVGSGLTGGGQLGWKSAIGMAGFPVSSGYYFWLKTSGRCWGTGASTWPGQTQYYRDVYANTDGSLIGYTAGYQRVGYLLSGTQTDYGDVFFMLQLEQGH